MIHSVAITALALSRGERTLFTGLDVTLTAGT